MHELERTWKVGELARATGLTIRALHHYDDIGLLVPSRTQSGHRLYSPDDVERLYRVLALRSVGLSLDEIRAVLDDDEVGLVDTVRRHVAALERDIEQRRRLLDRLRESLLRQHGVTPDALRGRLGPGAAGEDAVAADVAMPMTTHAQFALTGASAQARRRGTLEIAPMHLLLALVIPPDTADALGLRRDQVERLREDVRAALDAPDP